METKENDKKKKETKCCESGESAKDFQGMCEKMKANCSDQIGSGDCAAMMENMMKGVMNKSCDSSADRAGACSKC
jgi:hypothetical protein